LDKNALGYVLGDIFHKLIWSPCTVDRRNGAIRVTRLGHFRLLGDFFSLGRFFLICFVLKKCGGMYSSQKHTMAMHCKLLQRQRNVQSPKILTPMAGFEPGIVCNPVGHDDHDATPPWLFGQIF
jgi:hypothetical protein